jgi:hypothetical protein
MEDILVSDVLNLVYDDWPEGTEYPNANRPKHLPTAPREYDTNSPWMPSYATMRGGFPGVITRNYVLKDVIQFPEMKFFYHVWHRNSLWHDFFSKGLLPIDEDVISMVKTQKNLHLIFMNETEVDYKESLKWLNDILLQKEINPSNVWVINNNQKLQDWKIELNTRINVHSCRLMPLILKHEPRISFKPDKDAGSFFLCHNRTPRGHRYGILCLLKKHNLLYDTNWSLINGWQSDKNNPLNKYNSFFTEKDIGDLETEIKYFEGLDMVKSKYELHDVSFDDKQNQNVFNSISTYENSYINLATETNFTDEAIHISEKSLKPFYYLQLPLILASFEHNKYLKQVYGFDLFEDVINYEYDAIRDNRERMFAYVKEAQRLHENKEAIVDFYRNNRERFIKNQEIVSNYKNDWDYNFFKTLAN